MPEYTLDGKKTLETECIGQCPRRYRIDPMHPEYERTKAALDRGDRSILFCYHKLMA